jgi:DNA-directed RNA polymerase subunit L
MTELETHLLTALKTLGKEYNTKHEALEEAQATLKTWFSHIYQENEELKHQVTHLSEQIETLSSQLSKFERLYKTRK